MNLEEIKAWFEPRLPIDWLTRKIKNETYYERLRPPAGTKLELAPTEVAIVLPDVHLGWGNDVFRYNNPQRERRLERFFDVCRELKAHVGGALEVVQVGDWYDFWRAPGLTAAKAKSIIEAQYPGVVRRARELGVKHCIGNHDAAFVRPEIRKGIDAEIVRTLGQSHQILCLHGHDTETLGSIAVNGTAEAIGLNILNIVNSTVPGLGLLGSVLQRVFDASSQDPWSSNPNSLPWQPAVVPGPKGWGAPWVGRDSAVNLGGAVRGFELCVRQEVQVVLVGHSHRPGISWSPVAQRRVPVVDVGSWTYGRSEFAVVCPDGIGLARLR